MTYKFKYRTKFWWHTVTVVGHNYIDKQDKMCLYFQDGSLREIREWTKCEVKLGTDWVASVKKRMERESGTSIPLDTEG